jgi:hypothetical protein
MATDCIGKGFAETIVSDRSPREIADHILREHQTTSDDAFVLVARWKRPETNDARR